MNTTPQDVIAWLTHPFTYAAIIAIGGFFVFVAGLIGAWIKIVHPHVESGIVAKAQKPFNDHVRDAQGIRSAYDQQFALLQQSHGQIHSEIAEIKSSVGDVREKQDEHGKLIVGLTVSFDEFRKSMNGAKRPKHHDTPEAGP